MLTPKIAQILLEMDLEKKMYRRSLLQYPVTKSRKIRILEQGESRYLEVPPDMLPIIRILYLLPIRPTCHESNQRALLRLASATTGTKRPSRLMGSL